MPWLTYGDMRDEAQVRVDRLLTTCWNDASADSKVQSTAYRSHHNNNRHFAMSRSSFTVPVRGREQTSGSTADEGEQRVLCNVSSAGKQRGLSADDQHQIPAKRFMSRTQANPNRWYYACAKDREDPKRCKFFKWEDELDRSKGNVLGGASPAKGQTLGAAPGTPSRLMRPTPGSATPQKTGMTPANTGSVTPSKSGSRVPNLLLQAKLTNAAGVETPRAKRLRRWNEPPSNDVVAVEDSDEEGSSDIDWGSIDADKLEEEARSQTNTPRAIRFDATPVTETRKRKLDTLAEDESVSWKNNGPVN